LQLPEVMTLELAELLGFYIGDGYWKERRGLGIAVDSRDSDLIERLKGIISQAFNLDAYVEDTGRNCLIVWAGSYFIPRWMHANGLAKSSALDAQIPEPVLAGGATTVAAFLRGLFESDGSHKPKALVSEANISKGIVTLVTASERLAREVQIALLGLGIVSTRRVIEQCHCEERSGEATSEGRYGTSIRHEVRLLNSREVLRFRELVGFASKRKQTLLETCEDKGGRVENPDEIGADSIPSSLLRKIYTESEGLPTGIRQEIAGALRCGMTQERWRNLVSANPVLEALPSASLLNGHLFFDVVADINLDNSFTFDLSVPETNTYIANGIVAHNTIGTMVGTSTGIEPFYFWTHYRTSRLGTHEVNVNVVEEWKQKHPGEKLPPYFVTAMDLTPEEHVRTQAAIQRWIDASISKTSNTPNDFTVEQMRELYELMYELGCKGGTVYRDGSRDEQVLKAKEGKSDSAASSSDKVKVASSEATVKVRPRPYKRHGVTVSQRTPSGTVHITMNNDESGQPFEVFVEIGKGGSDIKAMAEAMGRLMSLLLRLASPVTPLEKVQEIVNQIRGIGGARSLGFGKDKVLSLPDAVGKALEEHYGVQGYDNHINPNAESPAPEIKHPHGVAADICPVCGQAAFVRQEGCMSCHACGHSEC
jgi:intein/homing endonuclease